MPYFFNKVPSLHKHACRAAGRIKYSTVVGFYEIDDHPDQTGRREELAAFLSAALCELVEEVFVDAPEHVAFSLREHRAVEDFNQLSQ